jgi:hypothetical protein
MKKETLAHQILKRFRLNWRNGNDGFVNSQTIQDVMHPITGKKHETIGRALRLMAEDGLLQSETMKKEGSRIASVYYKYIPTQNEQMSMFMGNYNK